MFAFAFVCKDCKRDLMYGGQLKTVLNLFGVKIPQDRIVIDSSCKEKIFDTFNSMDVNGDGYLSPEELTKAMRVLTDNRGKRASEDIVESMIETVDADMDGRISFAEFMERMLIVSHGPDCDGH